MSSARLTTIDLPTFGRSEVTPELPASIYPARVERLRERAARRGIDWLVVYADREHSANLAYVTGFDPRFEEAILLLGAAGRPVLLAGNECIGLAHEAPLPVEAVLFQELSLPSQPRDRSTSLAEAGVRRGSRIGVIGCQLHLDEWVSSPVTRGSTTELRSGMVMQVDIIPATGGPYFTTNIEDGVALADASLRAALAAGYPEMWERIGRRRAFMRDVIGIDLHRDVLPLSNIPALLPPYLLRPDRAMTLDG